MTINGSKVLAYSPVLEIVNSSIPFRAYLGALLSVVKNVPVQQSSFPVDAELDTLEEDPDEDEDEAVSDGDHGYTSDEYKPPGGGSADGAGATTPPMTRSHRGAGGGNGDSELMVCFPMNFLRQAD